MHSQVFPRASLITWKQRNIFFTFKNMALELIPKLAHVDLNETLWKTKFVDIGINLTDPVYQGIYNGTKRHKPDLSNVIERAQCSNCCKLIVTGSDLSSSKEAIELAREYPNVCYATVGVHPCCCMKFLEEKISASTQLAQISALAQEAKNTGHAVAFGEIGLDYDRLSLCPKDVQLEFFERQLSIAVEVQLPLFLHSRAAHKDFMRLLTVREAELPNRGVVHSFTGSVTEMEELVLRGWHIGINGCSLKSEASCEVVRSVPLHCLHLETDGPWCEIRPSHAGSRFLLKLEEEGLLQKDDIKALDGGSRWVKKEKWEEGACVKGRNEPCTIPKVAWIVAGLKGVDIKQVVDTAWNNSVKMFNLGG